MNSNEAERNHLLQRMIRPIAQVTMVAMVVLATATAIISGVGSVNASPGIRATADLRAAGDEATTGYGAVVVALTGHHPETAIALLPSSFRQDRGYRPVLTDGYPTNPTGDCSSPLPLPDRFTVLCAGHDFGYDVLRAAAHSGHPLHPWARLALDTTLIDRMLASCPTSGEPRTACLSAAETARIGLALNTWRQRGGPPRAGESTTQLIHSTIDRATDEVSDALSWSRR